MTKRVQIGLLILLSMMSVFFAEVIAGSMPFPLFEIWGYVIVLPLYGLHTIILLFTIKHFVKDQKVSFSTLYFAGVLFGLYEAYITKVLWLGLSEDSFILWHISIMDYIVLVFFWHPIFSFIIPSIVFEKLMTKTDYLYQGLPSGIRKLIESKYGLVIIMVFVGLFASFNGTMDTMTLSELSLLIPILLLVFLFRKKGLHHQYSFAEILPENKGIIPCIVYLIGVYLVTSLYLFEGDITLERQIPIWISYVVFGFLFVKKIQKNRRVEPSNSTPKEPSSKQIFVYSGVILVSSLFFVVVFTLLGIKDIVTVITWVGWIVSGLYVVGYSILH